VAELNSGWSVRPLQRNFRDLPEPQLRALEGRHEDRVNDELRPLDDDTLLGLSFGLPLAPRGGAPFILNRRDETP
jgi:hypothetical protein